ncbi:hypothetical protein BC941DRAFT_435346 [Chlamydoabsidia padenii]|nr:hypothetical protein BC941DRAFT_435346 [Chlamydoabsidia padenii]
MKHCALFSGLTRNYKTCSRCRDLQTPIQPAPLFDELVFLSDLPIDATFFSGGTNSQMECDVYMDDRLMALSYEDIAMEIIEAVHQQTGYRHWSQRVGRNILAHRTIFYARCVLRRDLRKHLDSNQRKRQVLSLPMFNCKGEIKGHINKDQNWIHLEITHAVGHPSYSPRRIHLTDQERRFITGLAVSTSTPEIHRAVVENFGHHITRAQVYYWRLEATQHLYRLHNDPMVSCRRLIAERNQQGFGEGKLQADYSYRYGVDCHSVTFISTTRTSIGSL